MVFVLNKKFRLKEIPLKKLRRRSDSLIQRKREKLALKT
jgi:hypothetical protein